MEPVCALLLMRIEKNSVGLWIRAGKPLEMTVAFADVGKGNPTIKPVLADGIMFVVVADAGEKEMWEMNGICPDVCVCAWGLNRRLQRKYRWMRIEFIKCVLFHALNRGSQIRQLILILTSQLGLD